METQPVEEVKMDIVGNILGKKKKVARKPRMKRRNTSVLSTSTVINPNRWYHIHGDWSIINGYDSKEDAVESIKEYDDSGRLLKKRSGLYSDGVHHLLKGDILIQMRNSYLGYTFYNND
jgi:hypothetical protein